MKTNEKLISKAMEARSNNVSIGIEEKCEKSIMNNKTIKLNSPFYVNQSRIFLFGDERN